MGIDWFTFVAQIINFLILVALLRKFLYGPIVHAMDEREAGIAAQIADASQRQQDAAREAEAFRLKSAQLDERQQQMLAEVSQEVAQQRETLMQEARESVDHNRTAWHAALTREQNSLLQEVRRETGSRAVQIARRALREFADRDLHEQLVDVFLRRLAAEGDEQQQQLRDVLAEDNQRPVISSAFPLSEDARSRIRAALAVLQLQEQAVEFRESEELLCGIEVRVGGHRISWSFEDFLDSVGLQFEKVISQPTPTA